MPLDLIRRLVKGEPLTAEDHDANLDELEDAIEGKAASGAPAAAIASHVAAGDPHPGYLLESDPAVTNARTPTAHKASHAIGGDDALTPADIGAATAAQGALASSAVQPGSLSAVATTGAYGDLSGRPTLGTAAALNVGTTTGTVAAGDDARFHDAVTLGASVADVLNITGQALSADDPGADRLLFWDDSEGKLTHLTLGTNLSITGATLDAAGGSTNLTYTAGTRLLESSTGTDVTLPLFTSAEAGLVPLSGGGTTNFLRADGTWANPGGFNAGNPLNLTANGAASTPPLTLSGTWFSGGTGTTTKPQLLIEPAGTTSTAWSTSGTGLGINAPSGFAGRLIDAQVDGITRLAAVPNGFNTRLGGFSIDQSYIEFQTSWAIVISAQNGGSLTVSNAKEIRVGSDNFFAFGGDAGLYRDAADTLAQRRSTNAQISRIYDTYTSSIDYHRLAIATARATLSNVSGASVTATGLIPDGAVVVGVTSKVTTALGTGNGTTGYQIGDGSDADRWGAITGTALGTSSDNTNWTATTVQAFTSATDVVVTATGGNFNGTGVIYLSVQYLIGQAD